MTEHATPQEPAPGSAGRVVGTTESGPGGGHPEPHHHSSGGDSLASVLSAAQFLFTAVILVVVAGLMYTAGFRTGKGGEGGGAGETPASPAAVVDVAVLLQPTPEHVASGKSIFAINCASCHGPAGKGDGPAAAALNPKPRDFTSGFWRYGGGVARVVRTITEGSPGTAMAPFPGIPLQDRFALAHYIRAFDPEPETDKAEDSAWLDQFGGGKRDTTGGAAPAVAGAAPGDTIPIARAIALLTEPAPDSIAVAPAAPPDSAAASASGEGARLYARRCASCHGASGEGGVRTRMLGSAPYAYVTTRGLAAGTLARDAAGFDRLVIRGLPGLMPANGDLTTEQVRTLYSYTQSLRARQVSVARARS
jgi:mono/diheme cytochrome c family protein